MKHTYIFVVLSILLSFSFVYAEETESVQYVLQGSMGPAVQTWEMGPCAYIANGVKVYPQSELPSSDNPHVCVPVRLLGMDDSTATTLYVPRADIVEADQYSGIYDFPGAYVWCRTPFYKSISEDSREIHGVLVKNDQVRVYAHIDSYYYIAYQGLWGYISDDAIDGFYTTKAYRNYNSYLEYSEIAFVRGTPSGNEPISSENAVALARTYLTTYYAETDERLDRMTTEVDYNISHMYGNMGTTWYIEFWGYPDTSCPPLLAKHLTPSQNADTLCLFYTIEVNTDTGEVYLIAVGHLG